MEGERKKCLISENLKNGEGEGNGTCSGSREDGTCNTKQMGNYKFQHNFKQSNCRYEENNICRDGESKSDASSCKENMVSENDQKKNLNKIDSSNKIFNKSLVGDNLVNSDPSRPMNENRNEKRGLDENLIRLDDIIPDKTKESVQHVTIQSFDNQNNIERLRSNFDTSRSKSNLIKQHPNKDVDIRFNKNDMISAIPNQKNNRKDNVQIKMKLNDKEELQERKVYMNRIANNFIKNKGTPINKQYCHESDEEYEKNLPFFGNEYRRSRSNVEGTRMDVRRDEAIELRKNEQRKHFDNRRELRANDYNHLPYLENSYRNDVKRMQRDPYFEPDFLQYRKSSHYMSRDEHMRRSKENLVYPYDNPRALDQFQPKKEFLKRKMSEIGERNIRFKPNMKRDEINYDAPNKSRVMERQDMQPHIIKRGPSMSHPPNRKEFDNKIEHEKQNQRICSSQEKNNTMYSQITNKKDNNNCIKVSHTKEFPSKDLINLRRKSETLSKNIYYERDIKKDSNPKISEIKKELKSPTMKNYCDRKERERKMYIEAEIEYEEKCAYEAALGLIKLSRDFRKK